MNYIALINQFWQCDIEHSFSGSETRLYFYLLHTCNSLRWKNPFTHADAHLTAMVGMGSVNTLKTARNRLKQAGLLDFTPGSQGRGHNHKATYKLSIIDGFTDSLPANPGKADEKPSENDSLPDTFSANSVTVFQRTADSITKHKPEVNETKPNLPPASADAGAGGPQKKIGEVSDSLTAQPAQPPAPPVAAAPPKRGKAARVAAELLPDTCELAEMLNPGGLAERVQLVPQPLTAEQAARLIADYSLVAVRGILCQMANWQPLLTKCTSANLTARNWLDKRATDSTTAVTTTSHVSTRAYPPRSANGAKPSFGLANDVLDAVLAD